MSDPDPIVADGRDRLRGALAALPPEERREAERRLELEGHAWGRFGKTRLSRWPLLASVARWIAGRSDADGRSQGPIPGDHLPVDHLPVDRRCYLDASPIETAPRDLHERRRG